MKDWIFSVSYTHLDVYKRQIILFVLPMMAGNLLQQFYNIADTLIVGRFLGSNALAAVGSAYTLMTFLTSILLGLSMGAGALFSIYQGQGDTQRLKAAVLHAFGLIFVIAAVLNVGVYLFIDPIMAFLHVPKQVYPLMRDYLWIIFAGVGAAFLYNFFAGLLRAMGNSSVPLIFLSISACLNIGLDLLFVLVFGLSLIHIFPSPPNFINWTSASSRPLSERLRSAR